MENKENEKFKNSKVIITNKNQTSICGVDKVISATENIISFILAGENASLDGQNLHVLKLDTELGTIDVEGEIKQLKLSNSKAGKNFIKKIFS